MPRHIPNSVASGRRRLPGGTQQRFSRFLGSDMGQRLCSVAFFAVRVQAIRAARVLVKVFEGLFLPAFDTDFGEHGVTR